MRIASWNVNSLRVRLPQVLDWLQAQQPDALALQETKLADADFPVEAFEALGYHVAYSGQKTYNGVAVISKLAPTEDFSDIPELDDPQRRILGVTLGSLRLLNLYVVNGQEVGSEKYGYKLEWLKKVTTFLREDIRQYSEYVVLGDFNIAPDDRDVHDPAAWDEQILCSTPEREALNDILDLGFSDTFRLFDQDEKVFSWWDYRAAAFRRNLGLRIDLILASPALASRCVSSRVDRAPRAWERPSDHAPVVADFSA